jgi:hypothetical protein
LSSDHAEVHLDYILPVRLETTFGLLKESALVSSQIGLSKLRVVEPRIRRTHQCAILGDGLESLEVLLDASAHILVNRALLGAEVGARNRGQVLSFGAARQEAVRLYRCRDKGTSDWIRELNLRVAAEINRTALASEKRKTPVDLIGGERQGHLDPKIRATVLDAEIDFQMDAQPETIKGDDYLLEYDSDGYPELPACLYRRKPRLREAA